MLNIALPKGRLGEKVYAMFAGAGFECPELLENSMWRGVPRISA